MNDLYKDDPEQKQQAYLKLAQQSPYMKSLLKGVLDSEDTEAAASSTAPRPPGLQDEDRKGSAPTKERRKEESNLAVTLFCNQRFKALNHKASWKEALVSLHLLPD
eukprot:s8321_g2.t1